jgi:predicted nucleic acid-binding protein
VPDLLVDTSAFYAVADPRDAHHEQARAVFEVRGELGDLVTTDAIVIETWLLLNARRGRSPAMRFWDSLESGVVRVLGVAGVDFAAGRRIAREWPDQSFSLVDCTTFALMERTRTAEALAFDEHFRVYRFGPGRRARFSVVP